MSFVNRHSSYYGCHGNNDCDNCPFNNIPDHEASHDYHLRKNFNFTRTRKCHPRFESATGQMVINFGL